MPAAAATNTLDRLIGWMSPGAGVKRARARLALHMLRSYEAAKIGRRTGGWRTSGAAANTVIAPALSKLRDRSRELVRNNPYARKAIDSLVANALGTGITLKLPQGRALWDAWRDECDADARLDFYGLQALAARTLFESGEVLVRFRPRRAQDGLSVPLQLQILEPDFLDAAKTGVLGSGNYAISGLEFNSFGQVVAYWLFQQHPGELISRSLQSHRVPASEVLHVFEVLRPGQVRGVPRLTASMLRMRDLDDYEEAELVRKGIEACFAAFVTMNDEANTLAPSSTEAPEGENKRRIETLAAGMIHYLRPGEQVSFGSPATVEDYADYTRTQLHAIAAGAGITFEQLTGDLSQVNFSSMRAGMIEFRRMVTMWQWLTFIPQFCRPILRRFAREALIAGKLRNEDTASAIWTTPKWDWVKPTEDVAATKDAISGGLKSLSESIRELGYDPDQVFTEIAEERKKLAELGIVVDTDAARSKAAAQAQKSEQSEDRRLRLWPVR